MVPSIPAPSLNVTMPKALECTKSHDCKMCWSQIVVVLCCLDILGPAHRCSCTSRDITVVPLLLSSVCASQGLWVHGNLLTKLPDSIGALSSLQALSAVGNQLTALPDSIGSLQSLTSLELAGNKLAELPESIGNLGTISMHPWCIASQAVVAFE